MIEHLARRGWLVYPALALLSAAIYLFGAPRPAIAGGSCSDGECVYAGQCYSSGACLNGQMCDNGNWRNEPQYCPNQP